MGDDFCMKHGVPYDPFDGCWRCESDAIDREKAKREATRETEASKDAEITRLRAEIARMTLERDAAIADLERVTDENAKLRYETAQLHEEISIRKDAHNKLTIINWDLRTKSDMLTKRVKKAEIESKRLRKALPNENELQCLRACINSTSKRSSGAAYPNPSDIASNVLDRIDAVIKNRKTS